MRSSTAYNQHWNSSTGGKAVPCQLLSSDLHSHFQLFYRLIPIPHSNMNIGYFPLLCVSFLTGLTNITMSFYSRYFSLTTNLSGAGA